MATLESIETILAELQQEISRAREENRTLAMEKDEQIQQLTKQLQKVQDELNKTTANTDPGVPRIIRAGRRKVKVFGWHVLLNGFRFGGHHVKGEGKIKPLEEENGIYDFDTNHPGFSQPNLNNTEDEMWVAIFAASRAGEQKAGIRFVPFLRVISYDPTSGQTFFRSTVGEMERDFAGAEAHIVHEGGFFSNKVVNIKANTGNSIQLPPNLALTVDDYILPSPEPSIEYKYLRTLKLDYSPSVSGKHEWRNFSFSESRTYSRTGSPFGNKGWFKTPDIPNTGIPDTFALRKLDFRHYVSPLATGVIVSGQAVTESTERGKVAYLFLCHDSSINKKTLGTHYIAKFGVDRTHSSSDGNSSNAIISFKEGQSLWALTRDNDAKGKVDICGWVED